VGKLAELSDVLVHDPLIGKAGIGHTQCEKRPPPPKRTSRSGP
jgi:hypothetical protein